MIFVRNLQMQSIDLKEEEKIRDTRAMRFAELKDDISVVKFCERFEKMYSRILLLFNFSVKKMLYIYSRSV